MATLTEVDYTRVSTDAAERFVDLYYTALNGSRSTISSFYLPTVTQENGRTLPHISYNGEHISDAASFQERWEKQMPYTHFEAQSVNVHVMNPCILPMEGKSKRDAERNMSLIVQVSGSVRLVERKEGPLRGFSDSFILVPNKEEVGGRGTGKQDHGKKWLIQSQTFRPNTDQEVEFTVLANGIPCDEYILPATASRDSNVLECFIPVCEGDQLTLSGSFTGSVLHGAFDLLADGSFLGDKRIEGPKTGDTKYHKKRKLDMKTVFDAPIPEGHTSIFPPDKIVEGNLHVKTLRDGYDGSPLSVDAKKLGVGSLAIVCSLNQRTEENYVEKYPSATCGDWITRGQDGVTDGGVGPTHAIEVKVTDGDVSKTRQQKHRRHLIQTHFGLKPWAKLIFHYRSKEAIEEAGCEKRLKDSQALEPGDVETFIRASTETVKKGAAAGTRSKRTAVKDDDDVTVASRASRGDALFTTPPPSQSSRASPSFGQYRPTPTPTPAPEAPKKRAPDGTVTPSLETAESSPSVKKKKLFGQSLSFSNSPATSPAPRDKRQAALDES
ncbi:hypothetical protein LTR85_010393 [Meristemomyces frigidus]|nr:hypothetical protein LTR85_010393 [Meristemomyces frigidus]